MFFLFRLTAIALDKMLSSTDLDKKKKSVQ